MNPEFTITGALIRYHSVSKPVLHFAKDEEPMGVVTLLGWDDGSARIEGCHLQRDESLPEGTVVIAPLGKTT